MYMYVCVCMCVCVVRVCCKYVYVSKISLFPSLFFVALNISVSISLYIRVYVCLSQEYAPLNGRYDDQIAVVGRTMQVCVYVCLSM